jgi:hypothetical protein
MMNKKKRSISYERFGPRRGLNKNMMRSSSCKRFNPRKDNEQKHHGELRNINNGGIRTIRRP